MTDHPRRAEVRRRTLLGRFQLDEQLERSIEETGLLDLLFGGARPDTTIVSDDGNRTVAWLRPSGEIAALLVQDYANEETRVIPFAFGALEIVNDGSEIAVFLL